MSACSTQLNMANTRPWGGCHTNFFHPRPTPVALWSTNQSALVLPTF